ncbi:hypothetical protein QTP88_015206 [Uroleucon formosanum]
MKKFDVTSVVIVLLHSRYTITKKIVQTFVCKQKRNVQNKKRKEDMDNITYKCRILSKLFVILPTNNFLFKSVPYYNIIVTKIFCIMHTVYTAAALSFHNGTICSALAVDNVKEDMRITGRVVVTAGAFYISGEASKIKRRV